MTDGGPPEFSDIQMARASLILKLRQHGVMDADILRAFEVVPHEIFVPEGYHEYAYREGSLPIDCGQSITSPTILAAFLVALEPAGTVKTLEVGTGSGYSSALLARMCKRVFSLERFAELAHTAQQNWIRASIGNIVGFHMDGLSGLEAHSPFDRILLNGAVSDIPSILADQLTDGGILVTPVGLPEDRQIVTRVERVGGNFVVSEHGQVRLAPLIPGKSRAP